MKKHAISNYYDSIDTYLDDSSKDNNKLSFNIKLSNEIPQIQINNVNGVNTLVYSDTDKIEALNTFFSPISTIDDTNVSLPNMYSLCNNILSNIIIEEQEISDIITTLPVNKAIGPDCMSQNAEINKIHHCQTTYVIFQQVIVRKYVSIFLENCSCNSSFQER